MQKIKQKTRLVAIGALLLAGTVQAYDPAGTPDDWPKILMDNKPYGMVLIDRLETSWGDEQDGYVWDAQAWYGGDNNRLWLKTEGEGVRGEAPEESELQLLYGRLFAPFWDLQIGLRQDFRPRPRRTQAVLGVQGVVPYEFEADMALFVSDEGDVTLQLEYEYELLITQRLILQPRFELNGSFSEDPEIGLRRGVNSTEAGLRLRYEFVREFAPYIGVSWTQKYAATADLARDEGEPTAITAVVAGIRAWF